MCTCILQKNTPKIPKFSKVNFWPIKTEKEKEKNDKKWMLDSNFFTFLKQKNDLLVQFLDPTLFRAEGPFFFDHNFFLGPFFFEKKNSAWGVHPSWYTKSAGAKGMV